MRDDPRCNDVWVCSRGLDENKDFFGGIPDAEILGSKVNDDFRFSPEGYSFYKDVQPLDRNVMDAILIRMPQPPDPAFLFSFPGLGFSQEKKKKPNADSDKNQGKNKTLISPGILEGIKS